MKNPTNAHPHAESRKLELVDIIDLKWLLAREGHHVHVERLQTDASYAGECLAIAARSPSEAVRRAAERLRQRLDADAKR